MSTYFELPPDDPIECWSLARLLAWAAEPDPNPNGGGLDCIVKKQPDMLDIPGVGKLPVVEKDLDDVDRQYLLGVLADLPKLSVPLSDDAAEAFLCAFRLLSDRPAWEPVLLTESRYLRECDQRLAKRWLLSGEHLKALQHWLDTDRIKAFSRDHVAATEMQVGVVMSRADALKYIESCGIESGDGVQVIAPPVAAPNEAPVVPVESIPVAPNSTPMPRPKESASPTPARGTVVSAVPAGRLLSIAEVSERTGISVSMLHEKMRKDSDYYDPNFPPKIRLGERTVRYSQIAVDEWIQTRLSSAIS